MVGSSQTLTLGISKRKMSRRTVFGMIVYVKGSMTTGTGCVSIVTAGKEFRRHFLKDVVVVSGVAKSNVTKKAGQGVKKSGTFASTLGQKN